MTTLHETIRNTCLDKNAQERGYLNWYHYSELSRKGEKYILNLNEASLLAMQELTEFYEWASNNDWVRCGNGYWIDIADFDDKKQYSTEELYQTWKGEQK